MATKKDYIIAGYDLKSKFEQVLNSSTDENSRVSLGRFKQFIDTNEVIKSIIEDVTKHKVAIDLNEFLFHPTSNMHFNIKEPQDIGVHILTMYKLIDAICSKTLSASGLGAFLIPRANSNKVSDILRNFLEQAFTPLFVYLENELKKGAIIMEETIHPTVTVNQTINGDGNIATYSGRDSIINGQALKEAEVDLKALIEKALQELTNIDIANDEKDDLADDLETLNSEINSEEPKAVKFRKVKRSLDSFISGADETIKKSVSLFGTLSLIVAKLNGLV